MDGSWITKVIGRSSGHSTVLGLNCSSSDSPTCASLQRHLRKKLYVEGGGFHMAALHRAKVRVSRWWTAFPVVIVLVFNLLLETCWPAISGWLHFLILIGVSAVSFGVTFVLAWLIALLHVPWDD
jgi:sterol desaturase/sphingolipid hydroxylase (fatty acid hydroxylase superfamily)